MASVFFMKKIGASLIFFVAVSAGWAQTNQPIIRAMSLQECFAQALQHNLDVQVQRYEPEKSLLNLRAAYGGYDPTFNISGLHSYTVQPSGNVDQYQRPIPGTTSDRNSFNSGLSGSLPWGLQYDFSGNISEQYGMSGFNPFDNSGGSIGVTLTQPILKNFWIDSTRLLIRAAKNNLKQSDQGLRQQIITTVTAVENAYYELIYAHGYVQVQQDALKLAQTQLSQDEKRVQVGSLAPLNLQQDKAQVAQSRANLIAAQNTYSTAENTLKNLLTDNFPKWHAVTIKPTATLKAVRHFVDLQDSWSKGMTERPDLLQARLTLEQQGIQLKFDRNQLFPELDLVGSYGYNGASREFHGTFSQLGQGSSPYYTYGARLSIPLSNVKARNSYKVDKAIEHQDLLKLKQLEQTIMVQIDNDVKTVQSDWESVDATRQARVYAKAALDAEQKKYEVGKSTTFTVLQLQNNLTTARSQEIRALANYHEALANLAAAEGTSIQRDDLTLDLH